MRKLTQAQDPSVISMTYRNSKLGRSAYECCREDATTLSNKCKLEAPTAKVKGKAV